MDKWTPKRVDCTLPADTATLEGKTAIVTGGSTGLGEAYVRALCEAKVKIVIGDKDANKGEKLAKELPGCLFVQCDVTDWDDQVRLFERAKSFSPTGRVHYVVANAGVTGDDDVFAFDGVDAGPQKPDLRIIDVNLRGTLYTTKLASHYFMAQNGTGRDPQQQKHQEDTCLVLISSGAGFLDVPRTPQYCSTKWAVRGIMHALRRVAFYYGSRVNVIAPWYVKTDILPQETFDAVRASGVEFATAEDAGRCLLRILADTSINGRSLFLAPRKWAPESGFMDLDLEDYVGEDRALGQEIQADQIRSVPVSLGLFP